MQARRRTPRPLLVIASLVPMLVAGTPAALAAPAVLAPVVAQPAVSSAADDASAATTSDTTPAPGTSAPGDDTDDSPGLPWPGIVAGGGLGLVAGIVLMVMSKRRENRG